MLLTLFLFDIASSTTSLAGNQEFLKYRTLSKNVLPTSSIALLNCTCKSAAVLCMWYKRYTLKFC